MGKCLVLWSSCSSVVLEWYWLWGSDSHDHDHVLSSYCSVSGLLSKRLLHLFTCADVCLWYTWWLEVNLELVVSYSVGPGDWTQIVSFSSRCLYPLSHLTKPIFVLFSIRQLCSPGQPWTHYVFQDDLELPSSCPHLRIIVWTMVPGHWLMLFSASCFPFCLIYESLKKTPVPQNKFCIWREGLGIGLSSNTIANPRTNWFTETLGSWFVRFQTTVFLLWACGETAHCGQSRRQKE